MGCGCKERREKLKRAWLDEDTRDTWIVRAIWLIWFAAWIGLFAMLVEAALS